MTDAEKVEILRAAIAPFAAAAARQRVYEENGVDRVPDTATIELLDDNCGIELYADFTMEHDGTELLSNKHLRALLEAQEKTS